MSKVPVPLKTLGPDTLIKRWRDWLFCSADPTPTARMWDPTAFCAFALEIAGVAPALPLASLTSFEESGTLVRYSVAVTWLFLITAVGSPSVMNTTRWGISALGLGAM